MESRVAPSTPNSGRCEHEEAGARCAFRAEHEGSHLMVEWEGERSWVSGDGPLPAEEWVFHQEAGPSRTEDMRGQSEPILADVWGKYWNEARVRALVREQRERTGADVVARKKRSRSESRDVTPRPRSSPYRRAVSRPGTRGSERRKGGHV